MKKVIVFMLIMVGIVVGSCLLSGLVNWICQDLGRIGLSVVILGYAIYRISKGEFDQ